ncbi:MAG: phytanoyl-CoA dioxygenase family protein [Planctomycetota bacterium]|nr:phytanoyl-CoA dioxygenase family protein [Planctomycetota bacterium]
MPALAAAPALVTAEHRRQYEDEGWFAVENAVPRERIEVLRAECALGIEHMNRRIDASDPTVCELNFRDKRYFIPYLARERQPLREFIYSDLLAGVCRATVGGEAYLSLEQFVVKGGGGGMKFGWHQDAGYIKFDNPPFVTILCALDDLSEANGTLHILPYGRAGTREKVEHVVEPESRDWIGYHGDDPGIPVLAPAGSLIVFSCYTFHRSGPNHTGALRRLYLTQFSAKPIVRPDGSVKMAEPFLKDGRIVACA